VLLISGNSSYSQEYLDIISNLGGKQPFIVICNLSKGVLIIRKNTNWERSKQDSVNNIQRIEKTYRGLAPHL